MSATIDKNDVADNLENRLAHLSALLHVTYGDGGTAFRRYNDTIQDNYL